MPIEEKTAPSTGPDFKARLADLARVYGEARLVFWRKRTHEDYLQAILSGDPGLQQLREALRVYDSSHAFSRFLRRLFSPIALKRAVLCLYELKRINEALENPKTVAAYQTAAESKAVLCEQAPRLSVWSRLFEPLRQCLIWAELFTSYFFVRASTPPPPPLSSLSLVERQRILIEELQADVEQKKARFIKVEQEVEARGAELKKVQDSLPLVVRPPTSSTPLGYNYPLLQLNLGAGDEAIKKAYRQAVLKYHPDKGGTHEQCVALQHELVQIQEEKLSIKEGGHFSTRMEEELQRMIGELEELTSGCDRVIERLKEIEEGYAAIRAFRREVGLGYKQVNRDITAEEQKSREAAAGEEGAELPPSPPLLVH